eukprot:11187748-Ditylum_brightwellii.AAC.1
MSITNMLDQILAKNDVKEEDKENKKEAAFNAFSALTEISGTFLPPINPAAEISEASSVYPTLTNIEKEEEENQTYVIGTFGGFDFNDQ